MIRYDVFHVLRDAAGVWRSASGERLTLPLSPADANRLCKVYDSRARQEITGGCSVVVDKQGRARLLFRTSGRPKPGTTVAKVPPFHHRFAAWNGKAWDLSDVGPPVNSGFEFDEDFLLRALPAGQLRAYVGVNVRGKSQLQEWSSEADGRAWRQTRVIFKQPGYALMAPKLGRNTHRIESARDLAMFCHSPGPAGIRPAFEKSGRRAAPPAAPRKPMKVYASSGGNDRAPPKFGRPGVRTALHPSANPAPETTGGAALAPPA